MIDKELIQTAKEKLGDRNFELIMDALDIQDYDKRNMRCLCRWHSEKTPSLLYNRKNYRVHCFGCGHSADLVDALIEGKHMTFNEAVEKIFQEAEMAVPMPEVGLRDEGMEYVYPTLSDGDMTPAYEYLAKRGISKAVVDYVGIKCDNNGVMEFPFYSFGDVLTMVKCRPARQVNKGEGAKCWVQKKKDKSGKMIVTGSSPLLFNANRINTELPLIITEGCIDALAIMECGYFNVVSVPLGAQNLAWIERNLDWLDQFQDIILCGDADEAGRKMNLEASTRLGINRCRFFNHPTYKGSDGKLYQINDVNECLYKLGKEATQKCIEDALNAPNPRVVDFSEIENVDWSKVDGISTGIKELDKQLIRYYRGSMTIIFAKPSAGKSSYINQVIAEAIDNDRVTFLYTGELSEQMFKNWFNFTLAGRRHIRSFENEDGAKYYKVSPKAEVEINKFYKDKLFVYRDTESSNIDALIECMKTEVRRKGMSIAVLDNLMTIDITSRGDKFEKQIIKIEKLRKFAKDYNVVLILVAHSKKTKESLTMDDASGAMEIANAAGRMISMERNPNLNDKSYDVMFKIVKDRYGDKNDIKVPIRFDFPSRRFFTTEQELNKCYKWDGFDSSVSSLPESEALHRMELNREMQEDANKEIFG